MQIIKADVNVEALPGRLQGLSVAVVADALDRLGAREQVMHHTIRPVVGGPPVAGRAFTIRAEPSTVLLDDPYEHEIAAVDAIPGGAFVVIGTQGTCTAAVWGELLATVAGRRGAVATVSDGAVRDLAGLTGLGMPTFAAAVCARDAYGRLLVTAFGGAVACGGVDVAAGDFVLADHDGVVVLPSGIAAAAVTAAEAKLGLEGAALQALERGTALRTAYDEHGVL